MQLYIDSRNPAPIYDQIVSQIKGQILSGALHADAALPSIRSLAKDLRLSVITTKRAYEELEREGFIYTVAAKGSFVAQPDTAHLREAHLRKIEALLHEARQLARSGGISQEEWHAMLTMAATDKEDMT